MMAGILKIYFLLLLTEWPNYLVGSIGLTCRLKIAKMVELFANSGDPDQMLHSVLG